MQQAELKEAVPEQPAMAGIELDNWNWKVVHRFVSERCGINLSRSSCLNYPRLHEGRLCTAWGVPRQLYLPVGVNQFCRFTSLAWPRCWAALVR